MSGELIFRPYEPGDEGAILATFNLVFRAVCGPEFTERTLAEWRWEFLENPAGRRIFLALAPDGRVAAQYAGVPIAVHGPDGPLSFFHAVDSMVHPDFRRGLRKRPLFVEVAERFFALYGGHADDLGFGYPVRPAWRIGERYLGYRLVRVLDFLLRPVGGKPPSGDCRVEVLEAAGPDLDELDRRLAPLFRCTTRRDRAYVGWRYLARPGRPYTVLLARRAAEPAGLAVVRTEGSLVPGTATLGDLYLAPDDEGTLRSLLAAALETGGAAGCRELMTVVNPDSPLHRLLEAEGFAARPSADWLERKLGARDWTAGLDCAWLRAHWHYCLGDSDLF